MVQGEKTTMFSASASCGARTSDPYARKAGFEAMQKAEKSKGTFNSGKQQGNEKSYGSWGPTFQNKQNFASMHWC